jgi:tRNA threonylcarbamoyladenosine biosynthesis protein TsaE
MVSSSEQQTKEIAQKLLKSLTKPGVLALQGELGAGKTTFIQGLAEGLGIKKRVLSPTFVFLRSYNLADARFKKFHHFDLYRCQSLEDVNSIGLLEIISEKDALVAIEWPEVATPLLPLGTRFINFKKLAEDSRGIEIS